MRCGAVCASVKSTKLRPTLIYWQTHAYLSIRQIFQHWSRHPQSWWRNVPGRASHWLEKTSKTLWIYRVLLPSFTKRVFTNPGPNESRTSHHLGAQEQIFANKRVNIKVNNYIVQLLLYSHLLFTLTSEFRLHKTQAYLLFHLNFDSLGHAWFMFLSAFPSRSKATFSSILWRTLLCNEKSIFCAR